MSQPIHSPHERGAASTRLQRAGLDPAVAAAVIEEVHRDRARFATTDQVAKIEVALARLQGDVRAVESGLREVEARLGGRIDVLAAEVESQRTGFEALLEARFGAVDARFGAVDARLDAVDRKIDGLREELVERMDTQFAAFRRENRLLLLVFSTMLGFLVALFRLGVI